MWKPPQTYTHHDCLQVYQATATFELSEECAEEFDSAGLAFGSSETSECTECAACESGGFEPETPPAEAVPEGGAKSKRRRKKKKKRRREAG